MDGLIVSGKEEYPKFFCRAFSPLTGGKAPFPWQQRTFQQLNHWKHTSRDGLAARGMGLTAHPESLGCFRGIRMRMIWSVAVRWLLVLMLGGVGILGCDQQGGDPPADDVYVVGSSFSWDAIPPALDSHPEWVIYCEKSLDNIFNVPEGYCVPSSTPWPKVLEPPVQVFGYISFQPVPTDGSTQAQDIAHISSWLAPQPASTVGVIHPTWPSLANWEAELHDPSTDHTFTQFSIAYYYDLKEKLEQANPGRKFVLTRSNEMMDYIFHDPKAPIAFEQLFRDAGHMSDIGHYLQHNAFRQAMNQKTGVDPTAGGLAPDIRAYLDSVVALFRVQ